MRKLLVSALVFVSAALVVYAGDPWMDKTYDQWDAKDVNKIMFDSPWAHIVSVSATWLGPAASKTQPVSRGGEVGRDIGGDVGGPDMRAGGAPFTPAAAGAGEQVAIDQTQAATAKFLVRWSSSRMEREAAVRNAVLSGRISQADAAKYLTQPAVDFEIVVTGMDMTPFASEDENSLKQGAFLQSGNGNIKVLPTRVRIQRDPTSKKLAGVEFTFPKETTAGAPLIGPDEKVVSFTCRAGQVTLKSDFILHKMAGKQGLDL